MKFIGKTSPKGELGYMYEHGNVGKYIGKILILWTWVLLDILDNWNIKEIGIFGYGLHGIDEIAYNWKFVIKAN